MYIPTHLSLTSFYQSRSSGMSPFSQNVFPGVHAGAVKLSCFYSSVPESGSEDADTAAAPVMKLRDAEQRNA